MARLESTYGKGKWCADPAKPDACMNIDDDHEGDGRVARCREAAAGVGRLAHDFAAHAQRLRAVRRAVEQGRARTRIRRHRRDVAREVRHAARRIHEGARSPLGSGAAALSEAARVRPAEAAREVRRRRSGDGSDSGATCSATSGRRTGRTSTRSSRRRTPIPGYSLTDILKQRKMPPLDMVRAGERFYSSLGFAPLPKTFWERSLFVRPKDREVVCHASAWDIDLESDIRIKMCIDRTAEDFTTIHHELGHNYYQRAYRDAAGPLPRQRERRLPRGHRRHDRAFGHAGIPGEDRPARQARRTPRATSAC